MLTFLNYWSLQMLSNGCQKWDTKHIVTFLSIWNLLYGNLSVLFPNKNKHTHKSNSFNLPVTPEGSQKTFWPGNTSSQFGESPTQGANEAKWDWLAQ